MSEINKLILYYMESTPLSSILNRMNRHTSIYRNQEEQFLVYDLDEALRALQRSVMTPWTLQKTTLRVFSDVLEYPKSSDHIALGDIEGQEEDYGDKPNPYYTSIQEFYDNPNDQSQIADIWDGGTQYLGVRNKKLAGENQTIDTCELDSGYTISGDFTAKAIDNVIYKTGNGSLKLSLTSSGGTALLEKSFTAFTDTLYKRKYKFFSVYLSSTPTSINLRVGADSSNYLLKNVTAQFSGQTFKANDWNLVAIDLNSPGSTVGTITTSTSFDYYGFELVGASTGEYYIDRVDLKGWKLMDYRYYSSYNIATVGSSTANQNYFINTSEIYSTDSALIGPLEFVDVVMYDAIMTTASDSEDSKLYSKIAAKREQAWMDLTDRYPSMEPLITTHYHRFSSQMGNIPHVYDRTSI
jgi:hypothetical protein